MGVAQGNEHVDSLGALREGPAVVHGPGIHSNIEAGVLVDQTWTPLGNAISC